MPLKLGSRTIGSHDSRALLPSMLKGVETVVGEGGSVRMTEYSENAAFVGGFVVFH
jgi:hypothetical protein